MTNNICSKNAKLPLIFHYLYRKPIKKIVEIKIINKRNSYQSDKLFVKKFYKPISI